MSSHSHHHRDGSSSFKRRSLASIQRKKIMEKILKIALVIVAIIMAIAVVVVYTIG